MFFISHEDGYLRCFNSFKCTMDNGNTIWNFSFTIDDKQTEFPEENNKTEEDCIKSFLNWVCPDAGFQGKFFIHKMVVVFLQKIFWISFRNFMKKEISKKKN